MSLFFAFFKHSPRKGITLLAYLAAQALFQVGILHSFKPIAENGAGAERFLLALFLVSFFLFYLCKSEANRLFAALASEFVAHTRLSMMAKIRNASLEDVEKIGAARFISVLGGNMKQITGLARILFSFYSMILSFVFLAVYMLYSSFEMGLLYTVFVLCLAAFLTLQSTVMSPRNKILESYKEYFSGYISALANFLKGMKELKVNPEKMAGALQNHDSQTKGLNEIGQKKSVAWSQNRTFFFNAYHGFAILAALAYLFLYKENGAGFLADILLPAFFMSDIVYRPLGSFNDMTELQNLFAKVTALQTELEEHIKKGKKQSFTTLKPLDFQEKLVLQGITHTFQNRNEQPSFQLGPINLTIVKGETLFIVGGNGSGKSTLLKTLTGLYPWEGEVFVDGLLVDERFLNSYQNLFGAIFTDFHIFGQMYGKAFKRGRIKKLFDIFHLSGKTAYPQGGFSDSKLSTGQRKRLALVSVFANEKEIYVFDEVAADQDPEHRKFFYEFVLADIKKAGKTAIVVSHDDHYFHVADRLFYMDSGLLIEGSVLKKEG